MPLDDRFIRLDTLEPIRPEKVLWGVPVSSVKVRRAALWPETKRGRVPYLPVSAQWAVRLAPASPLSAKAARIAYLLARDGDGCLYCGRPLDPASCSIEHIVPTALGGVDHAANLALAHCACNRAAGHLSAAEKVRLALQMREGYAHS